MSATLLPFGLLAVNKDGRDIQVLRYDMLPAAASIARNQLVRINPATGTLEAQTDGVAKPVLGTFAGVEYFDSTGRYTQAPDWVAQAGATNVYGFVQFDPGTIYEVQADGPVALTAMGAQCNMTNSAAQNAQKRALSRPRMREA